MDFLITYGWVMGVVTVIIVFLFASGYIDTSSLIKNSCVIEGNYFSCNSGYNLSQDGISITLKNNYPSYTIEIHNVTLKYAPFEYQNHYCTFNLSEYCDNSPAKFMNRKIKSNLCIGGSCYCDYFNRSPHKHGLYVPPNSVTNLNLTNSSCKSLSLLTGKAKVPFEMYISFEDTNYTFPVYGYIYAPFEK